MRSRQICFVLAALGAGVLISLVLPAWALIALLGGVLLALGVCGCKKR